MFLGVEAFEYEKGILQHYKSCRLKADAGILSNGNSELSGFDSSIVSFLPKSSSSFLPPQLYAKNTSDVNKAVFTIFFIKLTFKMLIKFRLVFYR